MAKSIAIKIDGELFRDLHIQAAKRKLTIEQYVTRLIKRDLFPERFVEHGTVLTSEQKDQIKAAAQVVNAGARQIAEALAETQGQLEQGGPTMM